MNIPATIDVIPGFPAPSKDKTWARFRRVYDLVQRAVNGNVEFGNPTSGSSNIRGNWVTVTTPGAPNTDFTVTHNLGRAAVGYIVMTKSAACDVYTSPTANPNPTTQLILRATAAGVNLTVFVI